MGILDLFSLEGKVALVTGAGQGIGRAYARALAEAGADVAVVDVNEKTGGHVVDEIASLGRRSTYVKADVTKPEEVEAMVASVVSSLGGLDVAVNNAWAGGKYVAPPPPEDFSVEDWDFTMNLGLRAVFLCAKAEAKAMRQRGRGKIVNAASISATVANTGLAYCVAKAGVVMLTKHLAAHWGKYNINVNCISPSYTLSPARRKDPKPEKDLMRALHPIGWYQRPEDLCGTLVYLASDASNYVTGQDVVVDGGHTLNVWLHPLERAVPPLVSPRRRQRR
ncbi:MAG: SDR family NAD(P)-dependent oxidoreductase [Chloroflexota bacterium]